MSEKKEVMSDEQAEALLAVLLQPERHERNLLKLCEEMAELSEVLLKYVNKGEGAKPKVEKIVEELGDVFFRSAVLIRQFDIEDEVLDRTDEKMKQIYEYYQEKGLITE